MSPLGIHYNPLFLPVRGTRCLWKMGVLKMLHFHNREPALPDRSN